MAINVSTSPILPIPMKTALRSISAQMYAQWKTGKRSGSAPVLLGPPGMAKTAALSAMGPEIAAELGRTCLVVVQTLVDREVTEVRGLGLPSKNPETGRYEYIAYTRSGLLPFPDYEAQFDHVLLVVDEVPAATMDHIKSVAAAFLDYKLGDTELDPSKYFVVGTGNRPQDRSGAARLPAHFVNRVRLMYAEPDVRPILDWMRKPESGMPPLAAAFMENRPALFTESKVPDDANVPFCTARSFTNGIRALMRDFCDDPTNIDPNDPAVFDAAFSHDNVGDATALLSADIGAGAAREFVGFSKTRHQLTPLKVILANPTECPIPTDPSALFAQCSYVIAWTEQKTGDALLQFVARLRPDLVVPTILQMQKKAPIIMASSVYGATARKFAGLVAATTQVMSRR